MHTTSLLNTAFTSRYSAARHGRAWFGLRRAELLEAAQVSTDLASVLLADGDHLAASDLIADVRKMMAEVAFIDGAR